MALTGDFISFSFNGKKSSDMGIIRTSNGSRFNENLLPTFNDKTIQVPGADGTYYFGSYYTQRQFPIPIATDELSETQFRNLKQWLGDKEIHQLIFDENPYKYYMAKSTGTSNLNFICFDDENGNRVYKGEGTLNFIAYFPFARSIYKFLDQYNDEIYTNKNEWAAASGLLLNNQENYDAVNSSEIKLYNPGDLEADFCAYFNVNTIKPLTENFKGLTGIKITNQNTQEFKILEFDFSGMTDSDKGTDTYIRINSKTNLIEGCIIGEDENETITLTGNVYNKFITNGDFFKIPIINKDNIKNGDSYSFSSIGSATCTKIEYDYLYF